MVWRLVSWFSFRRLMSDLWLHHHLMFLLIVCHFQVVKQRMQMTFSPYGNSLECIRCIYFREGLRAFYRSYVTQLTLNVPYQCTHFMIYEYMQSLLNPHHNYNPSSHFVSGGMFSIFSDFISSWVYSFLVSTKSPVSIYFLSKWKRFLHNDLSLL